MKKIITLVCVWLSLYSYAQNAPQKAKIESMKIGFITEKLQLTPEEAQVFWPVYNQFEAERKSIRESTLGKYKEDGIKMEDMTDQQAEQLINDHIAFRSKEVELQKKYIAEFKRVLPIKKVAKLMTLEEQFKKQLLNKANEMPSKPQGPKGTPPPPPKY